MGKRLRSNFVFIFLIIFLVTGCLGQSSQGGTVAPPAEGPILISQSALAEKIAAGGDFLLIDVRTPGEYDQEHLPGSIVIPYNEFETRYREIEDYKDKEVILYCHVGGMGDHAGRVLLKKGFTNVKNLEGGINTWRKNGGPLV